MIVFLLRVKTIHFKNIYLMNDELDSNISKVRIFVRNNGHLRIEATNFFVDEKKENEVNKNEKRGNEGNENEEKKDEEKKDEWLPIWDSLPINLQYNVGFSNKSNKYYLKFIQPKKATSEPVLELYDEYSVMIWTSAKYFTDTFNKGNINPHYRGYIFPMNYEVTFYKEMVIPEDYLYETKDPHNKLDASIKYIYTEGVYTQETDCTVFLKSGEGIKSKNGRFKMYLTTTGNLIMKDGTTTIWESKTANMWFATTPYQLIIDQYGDLVLRDKDKYVLWISQSSVENEKGVFLPYNFIINNEGEFYVTGSKDVKCTRREICNLAKGTYYQQTDNKNKMVDFCIVIKEEKDKSVSHFLDLDNSSCFLNKRCNAMDENNNKILCCDDYKDT